MIKRFIERFDASADMAVERIRSPQMDLVVYPLSSAADHSLLWHAAGAAKALARGGDVKFAARYALAMGAESALTNGVIKSLFKRVRPVHYDDVEFRAGLRAPITSSFPSGHATAAFCAARLLGGGGWYVVAAAVAGTRVYVRLHHASDVVAGAALGYALGVAMTPLVRR